MMVLTRCAAFSVEKAWSLAGGVIISIEPIGRLKECAPALHAVLRKLSPTDVSRTTTACASHFAVLFGPHCPIAPADTDANVLRDEVGQHAFDLDAAATIAPLFNEGGRRTQEMIVTAFEIGPG